MEHRRNAAAFLGQDDTAFLDLRDVRTLAQQGNMPDAFRAQRGMLEFWDAPESPYHHDILAQPKRFIFFCNEGQRSAPATKAAQDMGLEETRWPADNSFLP